MEKTVINENDTIKVTRIKYEDGSVMDKVKMKISDDLCITGCYLERFVDVEKYKKDKMKRKIE